MATITGLTASRMQQIEAASIVDGEVIAGDLILTKQDGTPINAGNVVGPQGDPGPTGPAGAAPITGDYKMSAQVADHVDSLGGTWYLCDGRVSPHANLTALVGANLPDARGRSLVAKGTHVDVDTIGDNDGVALANRSPKHNSSVTQPTISKPAVTVTDPQHNHGGATGGSTRILAVNNDGGGNGISSSAGGTATLPTLPIPSGATGITAVLASNPIATGGAVGPGGTRPIDTPAFVVPGSLFIYLAP